MSILLNLCNKRKSKNLLLSIAYVSTPYPQRVMNNIAENKKMWFIRDMPKNIFIHPHDLSSPDGSVRSFKVINEACIEAEVVIEEISPYFRGFHLPVEAISFVIKSTFAQLGVDGIGSDFTFIPKFNRVEFKVVFTSFNPIGNELLKHLTNGMYVGKLFAADNERRIRNLDYLKRLLNKTDPNGDPLLIFGDKYKSERYIEDSENNRIIVEAPLLPGFWIYDTAVQGFIPTIARGLTSRENSFRQFLSLHQIHQDGIRKIPPGELLLVRTSSMNIRTLFAKVVPEKLPQGYNHASADLISPQRVTGDIFEFHGDSQEEITHVPLEFYSLETFREHFFFADKDLLRESLEKPDNLFNAFETAPEKKAAAFIVKGGQLLNLTYEDWIISDPEGTESLILPPRNRKEKAKLKEYIQGLSAHVIAHSMQEGNITSQGIMLCTYLPPALLKNILLSERVSRCLKAIYFKTPSITHGDYFSHDDRSMLYDLARASIDIFWVDSNYNLILKYVLRQDRDFGMFVPISKEQDFINATFFGIYGSRLKQSGAEEEIKNLFKGLIEMQNNLDHEKLNPNTPLAIATGGGPGVMAMGNKIASDLGILSVGHAVDFTKPHEDESSEEAMNPYVQAKMTYRLEQLFIRQSEFSLDFPIFFEGGVGTDFEWMLEQLRTQASIKRPAPVLLFGSAEYWRTKITPTFKINRETGTIQGSEWISNTVYCVQNHSQALSVYYKYFTNRLHIGRDFPPNNDGFVVAEDDL